MHPAGRDRDPSIDVLEGSTEEGPALRDAASAAARAADDEAAAALARERLMTEPMTALEPDGSIGPHLEPDELVHALRQHAILRAPGGDDALGYGGTLYLTSRRLVHLGQMVVSVQLADIVETSMAGERLLIGLQAAEGISLDLDRPRELRAEIAAAMRVNRS